MKDKSASGKGDKAQKKAKTREPSQERSRKSKAAILEAALRLFSEKGYHKTNSKEIAAAAGLSTGSFYAYYPDKRQLFMDVAEAYREQFHATLNSFFAGFHEMKGTRKQKIRALIDGLIEAHSMCKDFHNELEAMFKESHELTTLQKEKFAEEIADIRLFMLTSGEGFAVKDFDAAAAVIHDAAHAVVDSVVFERTPLPRERVLDALTDMIYSFLFTSELAEKLP